MDEQSLHEFFCAMRREEQSYRYAMTLSEAGELAVRKALEQRGYRVTSTKGNARCDLVVNGAVRIEVKASRWSRRQGRYQASIHNDADVLIFACRNSRWHFFIIPYDALEDRKNIAIWSYDPGSYAGMWSAYYENWNVVGDALQCADVIQKYLL